MARFFLTGGGEASSGDEGEAAAGRAALRLAGREVVAAAGAGAGAGAGAIGPTMVASAAAVAGPAPGIGSLPEPGFPGRPNFFRIWPKRVWHNNVSGLILHVRESKTNPGDLVVFEATCFSDSDPVDLVLLLVEADERPQHVDVCHGRLGRGRRRRVVVGRHFCLFLI